MTVGYLLDLLIINEVRKKKLGVTLEDSTKYDLKNQNGHLWREIGRYLLETADFLIHLLHKSSRIFSQTPFLPNFLL